jgi:hypothetical protein
MEVKGIMGIFDEMSGCVLKVGAALVALAIIVAIIATSFTHRVDAGKVGLLIDYTHKAHNGSPSVTVVPQSTFVWYNSSEKVLPQWLS